jgi:predicted RNA-binding Zn-ribbon protein involved in translation (DUF1610 family)
MSNNPVLDVDPTTGEIVEHEEPRALAVRPAAATMLMPVLSVEQALTRRRALISIVQSEVLEKGYHYGPMPGTAKPKPGEREKSVLFKEGAEVLANVFGLAPDYELVKATVDLDGREHGGEPTIHYVIKCHLMRDGYRVGQGIGSCSSRETKYRYRNAQRVCPECGKENIRRSKPKNASDRNPGWYCWQKTEGCGATFAGDDTRITGQEAGKVVNPDIADLDNTILKMAKKRAYVDATITTTAASEFFTQDIEPLAPAHDEPTRAPESERAGDPVAHTLSDLVTPRQLVTIRALGASAPKPDVELICKEMFGCRPEELTKSAASTLIDEIKARIPNGETTARPSGGAKLDPDTRERQIMLLKQLCGWAEISLQAKLEEKGLQSTADLTDTAVGSWLKAVRAQLGLVPRDMAAALRDLLQAREQFPNLSELSITALEDLSEREAQRMLDALKKK